MIVAHAIELNRLYADQGYQLTLRQLYYQFVARDLFPASWADPGAGSTNNERSYKKLVDAITAARMAGLIDWEAIEDRTRNLEGNTHWDGPGSIIEACSREFQLDKWEGQEYRVEVWVEKDALEGVVERVARDLGDHDPSGIDTTRDIQERVSMFMDGLGDSLIGMPASVFRVTLGGGRHQWFCN
jgi:hypothetical protein